MVSCLEGGLEESAPLCLRSTGGAGGEHSAPEITAMCFLRAQLGIMCGSCRWVLRVGLGKPSEGLKSGLCLVELVDACGDGD